MNYLHHQCDQLAARNAPMLNYVARILTNAGILAKDLQELEQWIHSDWDNDINGYTASRCSRSPSFPSAICSN